jgi:hypothetical protein
MKMATCLDLVLGLKIRGALSSRPRMSSWCGAAPSIGETVPLPSSHHVL